MVSHCLCPFCAHPRSKTIVDGRSLPGEQVASISKETQHHSKSSHLVPKTSAATVNRRVASSNLARGAILPFVPQRSKTNFLS
jgi:hypothetical protein